MAGFLAGFGQGLYDYSNQLQNNAYRQALLQLNQQNQQLRARQVLSELAAQKRQQQTQALFGQAITGAMAQPAAPFGQSTPPQPGGGMLPSMLPASFPQVPDATGRMADNSAALGLIEKDESSGRNVNNYRFDPTHTAGGLLQITDSTWNDYAPKVGAPTLHYPQSPKDVDPATQYKVGGAIFRDKGFTPWSNFNPKLAADLKMSPEIQQQGGQVAIGAAGMLPPGMVGRGGPDIFARLVERVAGSNAPDDVKGAALMQLLPLMSQEGQQRIAQAWKGLEFGEKQREFGIRQDEIRTQHEATDAYRAATLANQQNKGWQVVQDQGKTYRVNPNTGEKEEMDLSGAAHKMTGGQPRSGPAMAAQKFIQEHPDATSEEIRNFVAQTAAQTSTVRQFDVGQQGNIVRSINVAVDHLGVLLDAGQALENDPVRWVNRVANAWAKETGQAAPTDFDAVKAIVKDELVKAVLGGVGALGDRQEVEATIDKQNSPEQLAGVVRRYEQLMGGQMRGLRQQFTSSGGGDEAAFDQKLFPRTREVLKRAGAPAEQQGAGGHKVGDIIEKGGKRWQVIGGDPNDPDVEPTQ